MAAKSVTHKLHVGCELALLSVRSSSVTIRRWSIWGGHSPGLTLQEMMGSVGLLECQTLSGLVQLPFAVLYVGFLKGGWAACCGHL